jgi:hypothetical protein
MLPESAGLSRPAGHPAGGLRHGGESEYHYYDEQCDPDVPHVLPSFSLEPEFPG